MLIVEEINLQTLFWHVELLCWSGVFSKINFVKNSLIKITINAKNIKMYEIGPSLLQQ